MLTIKKCEFIKSAASPSGFFSNALPQIAVAGKSNVGKSSFINFIANHGKLARTSNTPGRTQLVNYFDFGSFILTDLPGYGYAKVSKAAKAGWGSLIESYILSEPKLVRVIQLVDIRHDPTEQDIQLAEFFYYHRIPFNLVATKADKLSKAQIGRSIQNIAKHFNVGADNVIAVSSTAKTGKERVLQLFEQILAADQDVNSDNLQNTVDGVE
jgi:ribosome biogenesis GTP-binding protein ysxC